MTVLIAAKTKNECWMAYDSGAADGDSIFESASPKATKNAGGGIMGASGSWFVINMLDEFRGVECDPADISAKIVEIKDGPNSKTLKDVEVIMVWPNRPISVVSEDGAVIRYKEPFLAIGDGASYAMGYLEGCTTIGSKELTKAVEVAAKYSKDVIKPAHVIHCVKAVVKPKKETNQ